MNGLFFPHLLFWRENPALLLGVSHLLGSSLYLFSVFPLFGIFWLVYLFFVGWQQVFRGGCFLTLGFAYAFVLYGEEPRVAGTVEGIFSISSLGPYQSPFQKGVIYKGTLRLPEAVHCSASFSGEDRPRADCDYWVQGTVSPRGPFEYALKMRKWQPIERSWSLAETRYRLKESFRSCLQEKISSPQAASLLGSLITGDVEERSMRYEFSRVGLQHLLSISGFHFAVLIAFCNAFLSLFLPEKIKIWSLLLALSAYFVFVGSAPAVLRSFITAFLYLAGKLMRRNPCALNLLGCALLAEIILDPLAAGQIGFQLSFVSCGAILLLYPAIERLIQPLFPKRTPQNLTEMTPLSPYGYLLFTFVKKGVILTLAVNGALLPLLLYHFHSFPLLGLLYNLFFPLCVSGAIFALLSSLILSCLWQPLGQFSFSITNVWMEGLLDLVSYPPLLLEKSIRTASVPDWLPIFYLFSIFLFTIHFRRTSKLC